ncbi:MAG: BamA/TamA family outer membrane protein, partial [Luteibaculum sp.]
YTPETGLGFGAAGIYPFRFSDADLESQIQVGFAYTTLNQVLLYAPFNLYTKNYRLEGELGFYKYTYQFYGIGNEVPFDYEEDYDVSFPRIRLNAYRNIAKLALGFSLISDFYNTLKLEDGKMLASGNVAGAQDARYLGIGPALVYDSRNNSFFPTSGLLLNARFIQHPKWTENYFSFRELNLQLAAYRSLAANMVLAGQFGFEQNWGDVPFYQMAGLGGPKIHRGYYADRFRDLSNSFLQGELRYQPKRIGAVLFANVGWMSNTPENYQWENAIYTYGVGARYQLQKDSDLNLRFDVGLSPQGTANFYFTVLEAF